MNSNELKGLIEEKINEVFCEYYQANNITTGDITPEQFTEVCYLEERLRDLIMEVAECNVGFTNEDDVVKLKRIRTIAVIYPYCSLEGEFEVNGKKAYLNFDVKYRENLQINRSEICDYWTYSKPLDEVAKILHGCESCWIQIPNSAEELMLDKMCKAWNRYPHWDNTNQWRIIE